MILENHALAIAAGRIVDLLPAAEALAKYPDAGREEFPAMP